MAYTYLDYAATSPLCVEAAEAMAPYCEAGMLVPAAFANPNSLYTPGREAFAVLEAARKEVASALGVRKPGEIIFTSGATEADDTAILRMAPAEVARRQRAGSGDFTPHIITSSIEHDAVLNAAHEMERRGYHVTYLEPNRDGFIEVRMLEDALRDETVLVSIQHANSEIGSIQPIEQLCAAAHARGSLFHTDAVQALGKIPIDLGRFQVDAASFSAHKIGGPKGVGALYVKARTPFEPLLFGGGQESGRRSGTQNVCGAVGFAAACAKAVCMQASEHARLLPLRDKLYEVLGSIDSITPSVEVEAGSFDYLPNIVNVCIDGLESQTLILRFDSLGFAVSGGSACASASLEPSHVLVSLGIPKDRAQGALRISLGSATTEADIDAFLEALPKVISWNL